MISGAKKIQHWKCYSILFWYFYSKLSEQINNIIMHYNFIFYVFFMDSENFGKSGNLVRVWKIRWFQHIYFVSISWLPCYALLMEQQQQPFVPISVDFIMFSVLFIMKPCCAVATVTQKIFPPNTIEKQLPNHCSTDYKIGSIVLYNCTMTISRKT